MSFQEIKSDERTDRKVNIILSRAKKNSRRRWCLSLEGQVYRYKEKANSDYILVYM